MQRVSEYLEKQTDEVPISSIYRDVKGKREYVAEAVSFLVGDRFATDAGGTVVPPANPHKQAIP